MKKLCPTHRFYYEGAECPLCENERIERLAKRFVEPQEEQVEQKSESSKNREVTEEDIERLKAKFGQLK